MTTARSFLGAALVALASVTMGGAAHAQAIRIMSGGGMMMMGRGGEENGVKKVAGSVSADSLAALKKFIAKTKPMIMLDGVVTTSKAFADVKAPTITSVQLAESSDGDLKYYGDKAKNGILTVTTTADVKTDEAPKSGRGVRRARSL